MASTPGGGGTPGSRALYGGYPQVPSVSMTSPVGVSVKGGREGSSRGSLLGEGIDPGAVARLRRDVLERENQALAARLHDAVQESATYAAECERLRRLMDEKRGEDEATAQRMMELEISHAQRESLEKALEVAAAGAAEAQAQVAEAQAMAAEAQAMATEAEERAARRIDEAVALAKQARAEAAAMASTSTSSTEADPKPVRTDAAGDVLGFSPLSAARARADASSQECEQLRGMLNDLSATMRKRGLHALQRISQIEEERDAAEAERDKLLRVKDDLTGQIAGMREAAHEAVRQVRLEQIKEQHVAALRVGEMKNTVAHEKRVAAGARAETEAVLQRMGEHLDQAMAARRQVEEMKEALKFMKEEAKVLRKIASGIAKDVVEAAERGLGAREIKIPQAPPKEQPSPGSGKGVEFSGEYWYNPLSGEIRLL